MQFISSVQNFNAVDLWTTIVNVSNVGAKCRIANTGAHNQVSAEIGCTGTSTSQQTRRTKQVVGSDGRDSDHTEYRKTHSRIFFRKSVFSAERYIAQSITVCSADKRIIIEIRGTLPLETHNIQIEQERWNWIHAHRTGRIGNRVTKGSKTWTYCICARNSQINSVWIVHKNRNRVSRYRYTRQDSSLRSAEQKWQPVERENATGLCKSGETTR